jgi:hypothetical protein
MGIVATLRRLAGGKPLSRPYEPDEPRDEEHRPFIEEGTTPTTPKFMHVKKWHLTKAVVRLHLLCLFFGVGASVWG